PYRPPPRTARTAPSTLSLHDALPICFGIISRLATGVIADRVGGVATLLMGSTLQGVALLLYLFYDGLTSLYVISALFGLFQGGIDRKSTRLNSSHRTISYAVFCLTKK